MPSGMDSRVPVGLEDPSSTMNEASSAMEIVDFGGWANSIRLSNGEIELVVTTDVGPRIIRLGFVGGQNLFHNYPSTLGRTGDPEWNNYGGHRLWHAPEVFPRTYTPDNVPVEHAWDGKSLTLRSVEPSSTSTISVLSQVCALTELSASQIQRSAL